MDQIHIYIRDIIPVIKFGFAVFGLNLYGFSITLIELKFFNICR